MNEKTSVSPVNTGKKNFLAKKVAGPYFVSYLGVCEGSVLFNLLAKTFKIAKKVAGIRIMSYARYMKQVQNHFKSCHNPYLNCILVLSPANTGKTKINENKFAREPITLYICPINQNKTNNMNIEKITSKVLALSKAMGLSIPPLSEEQIDRYDSGTVFDYTNKTKG